MSIFFIFFVPNLRHPVLCNKQIITWAASAYHFYLHVFEHLSLSQSLVDKNQMRSQPMQPLFIDCAELSVGNKQQNGYVMLSPSYDNGCYPYNHKLY